MTSNAALQEEAAPILACTVSRDVQNFDLLIEDMEAECGEAWGDLSFDDAIVFLDQPEAEHMEFIAVAMDQEDEGDLGQISELVKAARARDIKVFVIAEEVSPIALHQLIKDGAEEFVPYPLPDGALGEALQRMRQKAQLAAVMPQDGQGARLKATGDYSGTVIPIHGLAGGVGVSTFAINLAWELANLDTEEPLRVCLLDLDLQFGSASTYLDLPRREAVLELLQDTGSMDSESFMQALLTFNERLHVLTAPSDLVPLDMVGPEDIEAIVEMARTNFDYVIIDMPKTVVMWTETVINACAVYFAMSELDMRSAQNTLRIIRALKGEELPVEKIRYIMNRAPGFTDLTGKSRVKRMAESLDIKIEIMMPDGGKQVTQSNDHGLPLAEVAAKNPLRREIQKLAQSLHEMNLAVAEGV